MSDSMIRVGRRGSNFIDANLLVFPKKKYPKLKKRAKKKAVVPKGKKAKPIIVSKVNKEKREYCEQIEPPVRMIEPASAINRATQCNRESH